jgi:hypothetical protein
MLDPRGYSIVPANYLHAQKGRHASRRTTSHLPRDVGSPYRSFIGMPELYYTAYSTMYFKL